MNVLKIVGILVAFGLVETFGAAVGEQFSISGSQHLLQNAEARVGRPLTPVSVGGVARRTVRRCAVGVYHCEVPQWKSLGSQPGQISASAYPGKQPSKTQKQTS